MDAQVSSRGLLRLAGRDTRDLPTFPERLATLVRDARRTDGLHVPVPLPREQARVTVVPNDDPDPGVREAARAAIESEAAQMRFLLDDYGFGMEVVGLAGPEVVYFVRKPKDGLSLRDKHDAEGLDARLQPREVGGIVRADLPGREFEDRGVRGDLASEQCFDLVFKLAHAAEHLKDTTGERRHGATVPAREPVSAARLAAALGVRRRPRRLVPCVRLYALSRRVSRHSAP